ncbi:hypothetical protein G4X40_21370 [Rhodococcus sp. D2-41]|uniref:hypothetical protein n=1 Tax=Speluncibacter jeojiensis TaxID=2710754 RepID=UPI00240F07AF|nr:hypothetical protein [Rhodococcus sp. D2-41]MDG3012694.1 hypothetical protein [Rhodococcus sp. D2-41]
MKIRKFAVTSALVIAATGIAAGTANAVPVQAPQPGQSAVQADAHALNWKLTRDGDHVIVNTDSGKLSTENGQFVVRNAAGAVVASVPLSYINDGKQFPVSAEIDGNAATLTPSKDASKAKPASKYSNLHQVDLNSAVSAIKDPIGLTAQIGGFVGAAAGIVGGCLLGAAVGATVSAPAALLFGAGPIAGCVGGALLLGSGASLAGTVIGGLGSGLANLPTFQQKLNDPAKK